MQRAHQDPIAFMSYVHEDDAYERLTELRKRLSQEARIQIGEPFAIFQDRNDIQWGQNWQERIEKSLDAASFLIPIITPSFFNSPNCRSELERFLEREDQLGRNDLVLPIYYVDTPLINEGMELAQDELAQIIASRQYADWRDLRHEPFTSPEVGKTLAQLGTQLRAALEGRRGAQGIGDKRSRRETAASTEGDDVYDSLSESSGRPLGKSEPPTRVVDPLHRGDHSDITEAVAAANPGDRILVRPGLYQQGFVVDKPLEIVGEGSIDEIVVEAKDEDTVHFQTTMGRLSNLTLRQTGNGELFAVNISQGRLELSGCDISSDNVACVAIHGGADPRVRGNRIHDGERGVVIFASGRGTLEDNEVFANASSGVAIGEGADPNLRRNRIFGNQQSGVLISAGGRGVYEDNDVFANQRAGVLISGEGTAPTLRRNRIHDGRRSGFLIVGGARGLLEHNDVFANDLAGLTIRGEGTAPTLRRNRIHDGKQSGIYLLDKAQGTLEDNEVFANQFSGVLISEGASPTLRRNRIHDNGVHGIHLKRRGRGTIEDNDILENGWAGVMSTGAGTNPRVRSNRITKNGREAIWASKKGGGNFEGNDLRDNVRGPWVVSTDSAPKIKRSNNQE